MAQAGEIAPLCDQKASLNVSQVDRTHVPTFASLRYVLTTCFHSDTDDVSCRGRIHM